MNSFFFLWEGEITHLPMRRFSLEVKQRKMWARSRPKIEQPAAAGLFLLHLQEDARVRVCVSVSLCLQDRHKDTETKRESQPCVWLVQNGKHVGWSVLAATVSIYATLTFSRLRNTTKYSFSAPLVFSEVKCRLCIIYIQSLCDPLLWADVSAFTAGWTAVDVTKALI